MNTHVTTQDQATVEPYSIDVSRGALNGTVSRQWASRPADQCFEDLNALYDFKKGRYDLSISGLTETSKLEFLAPEIGDDKQAYRELKIGASVKTGGDVQRTIEVEPTHWSFGQLCQLADMPASYFRKRPSQLAVDNFLWNMRFDRDVESIGIYAGDDELFAATGPSYGRIPDHDVVAAVQNIAGDGLGNGPHAWKTPGKIDWGTMTYDPSNIGGGRDRTFYASDRDLFVFLVDDKRPIVVGKTKDGRDDHMFRGFYVQNSEVGSRALKIASFYLRGVCMNRNLWGCESFQEITIRHTSGAPDRWLDQCVPALKSFSEASDQLLIESVKKVKKAKIAENDDAARAFLKSRQFSTAMAKSIMDLHETEEGKPMRSAWDFAQGITAFARSIPNNDNRLNVEMRAKTILDGVVHVAAHVPELA